MAVLWEPRISKRDGAAFSLCDHENWKTDHSQFKSLLEIWEEDKMAFSRFIINLSACYSDECLISLSLFHVYVLEIKIIVKRYSICC